MCPRFFLQFIAQGSRDSIRYFWRCPMHSRSAIRPKRIPAFKGWAVFVVGLALLTMPAVQLKAQSLFATVTGVVSDPSGAVVPGATVKLINERSGDTRETITNN